MAIEDLICQIYPFYHF